MTYKMEIGQMQKWKMTYKNFLKIFVRKMTYKLKKENDP